ncbi:MAG: SIMPL domain-containing protein [Clostridia bacterium]|nr:SIMPL domain-containing protein [Clostridia bacterium]
MKKLIAFVMVLCLLPFAALADSGEIKVNASATVQMEADYAQVTLSVQTKAAKVDTAISQNTADINRLIDALKKAGIAEGDIVTDNFSVFPLYDYQYTSAGEIPKNTGFQVTNTLTVTVRDLTAVGSMLDTAAQNGATEIYGLTYGSAKAGEAYDQALTMAIEEGRRKAGVMAAACGKELGELTEINETMGSYLGARIQAKATEDAAAPTIISDGVNVTANVEMVFEVK